jgi:multiple sugar transport system substrate-binding protein
VRYDNNALGITSKLGLAYRISAFQRTRTNPARRTSHRSSTTLSAVATGHPHWQQIVDTVLVLMLQKAVASGDNAALLAEAKTQIEQIQSPS